MALEELVALQSIPDKNRALFMSKYAAEEKKPVTGVLLALFLGGLGVHKFWQGKTTAGVLYLLFFWTGIPALLALIECFLMPGWCRKENQRLASSLAHALKDL